MKAWSKLVLVFLFALFSAGCTNPLSPSNSRIYTVLLNATWEPSDITVWTQLNGNSSLSTSTPADTGTGAGLFTFAAAAGTSEAYISTTLTPGTMVEVDLSIRPEVTSATTITEFHLIEGGIDRAGLSWDSTGAGTLKAASGASWVTVSGVTIVKGAWNHLGLEYSKSSHLFTVWKDGQILNPTYTAGTTLNARPGWGLDVLTNNSPGHTMMVDNFKLYY